MMCPEPMGVEALFAAIIAHYAGILPDLRCEFDLRLRVSFRATK